MQKQGQQLLFIVRSPWVLITIPAILGGMWLINNPWIITNNLDKPYALLAGPALVGSILAGWLTVKFFKAIQKGCKAGWDALARAQKEDSSAQFFWMVIIVFMIVSVFASGNFFTDLEHNVLPGLGYATAFFIDLVAVQAMKARLNAVRMRDNRGQLLYLFGVFVCSGASAFANVYTSLAEFNQTVTGVLPVWMLNIAPWFGLVFPALILLLSITADYTLDQTSTKLDPENYRKQELKRIALIEIQRDMLRSRLQIEQEIDQLTHRLKGRKSGRTFFLVAWLFPQNPVNIQQLTADITEQLKAIYEPQIEELKRSIKAQHTATTTEVLNGQVTGSEQQGMTNAKANEKNSATEIPTHSTQSTAIVALEDLPDDVQMVVSHYPKVYSEWLAQNIKSATIPQIVTVTGHKRQRVSAQVGKALKRTPANENLYFVTSVIEWLKIAPLPANKEQITEPIPVNGQRIDDLITGASTPKYWSKDEDANTTPATNGHTHLPKETVKLDEYALLGAM